MKEIQISIPKDELRALLEGKQSNLPFTISGDGEPLRIVIFAAASAKPKKFHGGRI